MLRKSSLKKIISDNIRHWIKSWFDYVETEAEFEISKKQLTNYMLSITNVVGCAYTDQISQLIHNIDTEKKKLLHYFFIDICTFDYIGSSIVESANYAEKKGSIPISSRMNIANSACTQVFSLTKRTKEKKIINPKILIKFHYIQTRIYLNI